MPMRVRARHCAALHTLMLNSGRHMSLREMPRGVGSAVMLRLETLGLAVRGTSERCPHQHGWTITSLGEAFLVRRQSCSRAANACWMRSLAWVVPIPEDFQNQIQPGNPERAPVNHIRCGQAGIQHDDPRSKHPALTPVVGSRSTAMVGALLGRPHR